MSPFMHACQCGCCTALGVAKGTKSTTRSPAHLAIANEFTWIENDCFLCMRPKNLGRSGAPHACSSSTMSTIEPCTTPTPPTATTKIPPPPPQKRTPPPNSYGSARRRLRVRRPHRASTRLPPMPSKYLPVYALLHNTLITRACERCSGRCAAAATFSPTMANSDTDSPRILGHPYLPLDPHLEASQMGEGKKILHPTRGSLPG